MHKLISKINKNKFAKYATISLFALIIVFGFIAVFLKYLISYSYLENKISELTGLKVEFINPEINLDYHLNLNTKAKEINIYDKNKTSKFISLNSPNITFKPLSLLFNKVYFKKIDIDNINIQIKRNSKGEIDFINSLDKNISHFFDKKMSLSRFEAEINDINLVFDDEYKIKSKIKTNLKNTKVDISKRKKIFNYTQQGIIETNINNIKQLANLDIKINSKYPITNSNDLNLNINLNDIDLYIFNDLAKKYISKDIESFKGRANLKVLTKENKQNLALKISNPTLKLNDGKIIAPYKKGINVDSIFALDKNKIEIKTSKIEAQNLLVLIDGEISNFLSKDIKANLNIDTKNTQINSLIPFIPDNAIFYRPKGIPVLKKSNFHALADGKINVKFFPLNITGDIKIQNVHIPNYPKTYKQNDVNLKFLEDKMRIYTRVYTPDNEYVLVDGISNLDNSLWGKYSIKSTSKIDLAFAQKYLVPIQQIIGFNIGPVPIMDIKGYGNININAQGTLNDAQIFGNFNAYNASAQIKGLDAKLENANCSLIFDNKEIIFEKIKGKLDEADFLLNGKTNIEGKVDLNAKIDNAKSEKILKIFNNSLISKPYNKYTKNLKVAGKIKANINLSGIIKDFENESFFEILEPKGNITFIENKFSLDKTHKITDLSGTLDFGNKQEAKFDFNLNNSKFNFIFDSKDNLNKISKGENFNLNAQIFSNKFVFSDIFPNSNNVNFYSKLFLKSQGQISLNDIKLENLKHEGYLIGLNSQDIKDIKFNSGIIKFKNDKAHFDNLNINYKEGNIFLNGNIHNIFSKNPLGDLNVTLKNIDLDKFNIKNSKYKATIAKIKNGQIFFKNNNLRLSSISLDCDDAPLFLNAYIKDIYNKKDISANFSTVFNEKTIDNVVNPHLITPIKITGEVLIKGAFEGNNNNYTTNFSATLPKNSDISFSGANLGDINYKRELQGNIQVSNNIAKINNLKLIKYIANQNNKVNPIQTLRANGQIIQNNNSISYDNLKISTNTPINVRILNLIFKKSLLKKGNFDCNITLNGDIKLPKLNGKVNLYDLDIPLYDTKIDNIKLNISNNFIDGEILAKNKQSDAKLKIHALNKLDTPYIVKDFILTSNKLDINNLINSYIPMDNKTDINIKNEIAIKPIDIILEKGSFNFKEVQYNKIIAQDLIGNLSYKDGIINIKNMFLNIAQGTIDASGKYEIKTEKLNLKAKMENCDSNILTKEFLNLPNQIFGKMDGTLVLSGKNLHTYEGINSIKSNINFSIDNGKMPKLGSLEYLLRAGNLFKNGLLGLSLNNLIEVLTPYKTGEFEKISGDLSIANGEIEKLNIFSKGKNLSLFLDGNYSIFENFADIKIYGKLSQKISNALGAIGNASINQFIEAITSSKHEKNNKDKNLQEMLDKIPNIETDNQNPRYFRAKVLGDINKDNYIKNFDWI